MPTQADVDRVTGAITELVEGERVNAIAIGDEQTSFQATTLSDMVAYEDRLKSQVQTTPRNFVVRLQRGF